MDDEGITRYAKIYEVVQKIPRGKVATYGQIAKIVGRCTARMVGYAMAALRPGRGVPWQRVVNHKGEISVRSSGDGALRQRRLLQAEGIRFDGRGRLDLKKFRWSYPSSRSIAPKPSGEENRPFRALVKPSGFGVRSFMRGGPPLKTPAGRRETSLSCGCSWSRTKKK